MTDLVAELQQKQEILLASMVRAFTSEAVDPNDRNLQFFHAYLQVVEAAAQGNVQPREDYLAAILPGLKKSGISFPEMVCNTNTLQLGFASELSRAHLPWYIQFCKEYMELSLRIWETSEDQE